MAPSDWPNVPDVFTEPFNPVKTPLKSAGSSSRVHSENHRDLGDAIEKIQEFAAKANHSHNGTDAPKLTQSVTHQSPDTNSSVSSLHHTLGIQPGQAISGTHTHNGVNSLALGISAVSSLQSALNGKKTKTADMIPGNLRPLFLAGRASYRIIGGSARLLSE